MAMRSMWMVFLIVMFPFQAAGWKQNRDSMDLAIGIRYHATSNNDKPPPVVIHTIKWLADNLTLGGINTNVAIVDFRDNVNVLLKLNEGISATKVKEACDKIGQGSYQPAKTMSMLEVAEETRKKIDWSTDPLRSHLPRVVLVFWEVGEDFGGANEARYPHNAQKRKNLTAKALEAKHVGAGFAFLNHFDGSGWPNHRIDPNLWTDIWVVFPALGSDGPPSSHTGTFWNNIASRSAEAIRTFMGMCWYTWNPQHDCYMHNVHGCVQNIAIDLKFDDGTGSGGSVSDDLKWFCFKTATIYPCADDQCLKTTTKSIATKISPATSNTTSSTESDDEEVEVDDDVYYPDDPFIVNLKIIVIVEAVLCLIMVPLAILALLWALRVRKEADQALKQAKMDPALEQYHGWTAMHPVKAEWSVSKLPELTQTPVDQLLKQDVKKGKSKKR